MFAALRSSPMLGTEDGGIVKTVLYGLLSMKALLPLPEKFQNYVHFAAGVSAGAKNADAAGSLIKFLTGPKAAPTFKEKGIQAGK